MSCWNKEELENMLEDVINVLDLSEQAVEYHGQNGTSVARMVGLVLEEKNIEISALKAGLKKLEPLT